MFYEIDRAFNSALARLAFAAKQAKKRDGKTEIAQSDPKDLIAIESAMEAGRPTYWIRGTDGTTYDVAVNEGNALNLWRSIADRSGLGYRGVQLFKRVGTAFYPYEAPRQVA
jgi:hypothetical protein